MPCSRRRVSLNLPTPASLSPVWPRSSRANCCSSPAPVSPTGAVFLTCGGSEAIESALKLARQYQVEIGQTQRYRVISRRQSYHGATLGALAISGNVKRREMYLPMVREFGHINTPYCYRCHYGCNDCARRLAAELEEVLGASDQIAAFVFEPVSGATLGAAVPPAGYLQRIAEICSQHGVLLIADEVMTGMGRTGRNFAVDHWGVVPDIIVAAKGLSSGYAPLGAVIAAPRVVEALASGSGALIHGFTYNAHPICAAAGRAVLKIIREQALVEKAAEDGAIGRVVKESLASLTSLPVVGDVRGIGLLWGVELMRDKTSKAPYPPAHRLSAGVAQHAAARGLAVYPMQGSVDGYSGDHLLIAPPAVLSQDQVQWAVENLRGAIQSAIQE